MLQYEVFQTIETFFHQEVNPTDNDYLCIYGSSVYKNDKATSDVDMLLNIAHDNHENSELIRRMTRFVIDMHTVFKRDLDEEVPFDNKLVYTNNDMRQATTLACFDKDIHGQVIVPAIEKTSAFLSSNRIKMRLALNALTTPHQTINKKSPTYAAHHQAAEIAISSVGISLCGQREFTQQDIFNQLTTGKNGETGEMYLGYKTQHSEVSEYLMGVIDRATHLMITSGILIAHQKSLRTNGEFQPFQITSAFTKTGTL